MDQDKAIKMMLLDLRVLQEDLILDITLTWEERYTILKQSLEDKLKHMFVVGYDYAYHELQAHNKSAVIQFDLNGNKIGEFDSIIIAAKQPGYHPIYGRNAIHNCLNGKYDHTKQGHRWKYIEKSTEQLLIKV
jgi:hypothetical protein